MPQIDFYQLTRDPAASVLPVLAAKTLASGQRLLVVDDDASVLRDLSEALWAAAPESFLAHGIAGDCDEGPQPILLSSEPVSKNAAHFIALTDGVWRDEALRFERVFYLFPPERTEDARAAWKSLSTRDDAACHYWRQDGGRWRQGP